MASGALGEEMLRVRTVWAILKVLAVVQRNGGSLGLFGALVHIDRDTANLPLGDNFSAIRQVYANLRMLGIPFGFGFGCVRVIGTNFPQHARFARIRGFGGILGVFAVFVGASLSSIRL